MNKDNLKNEQQCALKSSLDKIRELTLSPVVGSTVCKTCNGKKKVPKFDWYNGKLIGSIKCWECNEGRRPFTMFDNY